ncbi:MAG: PIN domain-containing protein [Bacteroidota bacterium]
MDVILVDTSVWVNFFKDIDTKANKFLNNNFTNIIIATCPTIVQEILQGVVSDADEQIVKLYFDNLTRLTADPYDIAIEAAELYRKLRIKGVTVRKPNDCLIAMYAIKNDIVLLNDDRDFNLIAKHTSLKIMSFD